MRVNQTGYTEKHHIIPKSLGGDNSKENIVRLTAKEHFVCHRLLCKMTEGKSKQKMILASMMLTRLKKQIIISSRTFESIRIAANKVRSITQLGKPSALKGRPGKSHTEETKQKLREINLGKKASEVVKEKIALSSKGKVLSEETKEKMKKPKSESAVNKCRSIWAELSNRTIVIECRNLAKSKKVALGKGWARRSDEWILHKIQELNAFS